MNNKQVDGKITECLKKNTDASKKLSESVWHNIQNEINFEKIGESNLKIQRKNRFARFVSIGTAAAVLMLAFFVGTPSGQAALKKVKEFFAPEKVITQQLEGHKEKTKVSLSQSKMGYVVYFDKAQYHLEKVDGKDRIVPNIKGENLPPMFMEITQVSNKSPQPLATEIMSDWKKQYKNVRSIGKVNQPLNAILLYADTGSNWNSTVVMCYLVDNTKGGTFIIKKQFILEASEGHGARFDNMLKEFRIVDLK